MSLSLGFDIAPEAMLIPASSLESADTAQESLAGKHILLVEDNPVNRLLSERLLDKVGIRVTVAEDGKQALEAVRSAHFDAILMDIQMPGMDGKEATRAIRADRKFAETPIIALTAHVYAEERDSCLAAGMDDLVTKPIAPRTLYAALERFLNKGGRGPLVDNLQPEMAETVNTAITTGLDMLTGMFYADGNRAVLQKMLDHFQRKFSGLMPHLRTLLEAGKQDDVKRLIHSLRGSASTIGATALPPIASTIENALKEGHSEAVGPLLFELEDELYRVLSDINATRTT
jgi:two-component system sensor histidine kinase/response regulator